MISSKALNFSEFLAEGWLKQGGNFMPSPTNVKGWKVPAWKEAKGNITPETLEILKNLQPYYSEISLCSWHPNITAAQYSDHYDKEKKVFWSESDRPNNINSRHWLEDQIAVKRSKNCPKPKYLTDEKRYEFEDIDDFKTIRKVIDSTGFMRTSGGSGSMGKDGDETRMQLFFNGDTNEETLKTKEKMITAGAYSFRDNSWKFIAAEDFSTISLLAEEADKEIEFISDIFDAYAHITKASIDDVNPRFRVMLDKVKANEVASYIVYVIRNPDNTFRYEIHGKKWTDCENRKSLIEKMGNGVEEVCPRIFPENITKKLAENPENYVEILKDIRGTLSGKNTGII
jgi:hypothetical protein